MIKIDILYIFNKTILSREKELVQYHLLLLKISANVQWTSNQNFPVKKDTIFVFLEDVLRQGQVSLRNSKRFTAKF